MGSSDHVYVLLMINFLESERRRWKPEWESKFEAYNKLRLAATNFYPCRNEIAFLRNAWVEVDLEVGSINEALDNLRSIIQR